MFRLVREEDHDAASTLEFTDLGSAQELFLTSGPHTTP